MFGGEQPFVSRWRVLDELFVGSRTPAVTDDWLVRNVVALKNVRGRRQGCLNLDCLPVEDYCGIGSIHAFLPLQFDWQ